MAISYLNDIDLNKNELQNAVVQNVGATPSGVKAGQIWFNSDDNYLYYYNGTTSIPIGAVNFETNNANIKVAGSASVGTLSTIPRADHVHPAQTSVSGNAGTATTLQNTRTIDGVNFNGSANISHFGTCSLSGSARTGTVTCSGFALAAGSWIAVYFPSTNSSTSTDPLLLNVNGTGGKEIKYYMGSETSIPANANIFATGRTYLLVYDGSAYRLVGDLDTHTEYDAGTAAQLNAGTVQQNMVWSPKILHDYVSTSIGAADAMRFKGTIGTGGTVTTLPTSGVKVGDTYRVITAGTYAGQTCEVGDLIIATATTPTWTVAQTNIDGAITSISSGTGISVTGSGASRTVALASGVATAGSKGDTSNQTPRFGGTFKVTSETIDTYGRTTALAEHTVKIPDTAATTTAAGLMSAADKKKLDSISPSLTSFHALNPALTQSGGVCTWSVLSEHEYAAINVYEVSTGKQVMAEISLLDGTITIKILSSSNIAAGKYEVVAVGTSL